MHFVDTLEPRRLCSTTTFPSNVVLTPVASRSNQAVFQYVNGDGVAHTATPVSELKVSKTGTLFVTGTSGNDNINFTVKRGRVVTQGLFKVVVSPTGSSGFSVNALSSFNRKIKRVVVVGLGGDDVINVTADVPVTLRGSAGDDTLTVNAPKHEIVGGSGQDTQLAVVNTSPFGYTITPVDSEHLYDSAGLDLPASR